jgi:protein-S-isoprenylcysteine O-methyltransferase Ste14
MGQHYGSTGDDLRDGRPSTSSDRDTPGVRVPPPLVFLATIVVGVAIDRAAPLPIVPTAIAAWLGGALVLVGLALSGLSVREFRKAKTTIQPNRPASTLVATGPFRYSRNPMYLALSIVQIGLGVWINSAWVLVLLVPALIWIRRSVIAREERHLRAKFGEAYLAYQARVRRWL